MAVRALASARAVSPRLLLAPRTESYGLVVHLRLALLQAVTARAASGPQHAPDGRRMDSIGTRDVHLRLAVGKPPERFLALVSRPSWALKALSGAPPNSAFHTKGVLGTRHAPVSRALHRCAGLRRLYVLGSSQRYSSAITVTVKATMTATSNIIT